MKKIKKNFGFGAILVSFIFIFNPNIHLIDLLPDAIGYLLLCLGLSQLADMNDYAQDALKLFDVAKSFCAVRNCHIQQILTHI